MRQKNSIRNSYTSVISNIITMLVGFISQAIFIKTLGSEYLGLNGLFTNILTILSFFELGIGGAIVFHLYKPIAKDDKKSVLALMQFYKRAYTIISIAILLVGLAILPFLKVIVGQINIDVNIYAIFIIHLINTSSSYLLSYKKNIIQANQKSYILNIVHILYVLLLNTFQMVLLIITHNYYIYLILRFAFQLLENVVDYFIANRLYPFLKEKTKHKIDKNTKKDIFIKVKAMLYHQIGSSVINGTDNIIISSFLGIYYVGLYSNYYIVINAVSILCKQMITATTASVGNLLVSTESYQKKYEVFNKLRFFNFCLSFISGICILTIMEPFITVWIGSEYILTIFTTYVLAFNFFQKNQRSVYQTFKDSAGIWHEDRFIPILESLINITASIILLKIFGLPGVFLGTIVSGLLLWLYSYPKYVYTRLFNRGYKKYYFETIRYILIFALSSLAILFISRQIIIDNIIIKLIVNALLSLAFSIFVIIILFRKDENYIYYLKLFKKVINNTTKKLKRYR